MTPDTSPLRVFVVGVPRSGTTLVQSLLASHSAFTSFTESHLFSRHFRRVPWSSTPVLLSDPMPRLHEFLGENGVAGHDVPALLSASGHVFSTSRLMRLLHTKATATALLDVLDRLARARGYQAWIEKTAQHLHYIPFLESLDAEPGRTHFVHVIRNGLDVVSSLHAASQKWERRPYAFARGPVPPYDVATCVRRWNQDLEVSLKRIESPTDHFVFYDDLTTHTAATLERVFARLGLTWESDILSRYAQTAKGLIAPFEAWKGVRATLHPSSTSAYALTAEQREQARQSLREDIYTRLHQRATSRADF